MAPRQRDADVRRRVDDDLLNHVVSVLDRFGQQAAADFREVGAGHLPQIGGLAAKSGLGRLAGNRQPAGNRFQRTGLPGARARPVGHQLHVADLHAAHVLAAENLPLVNAASADPRAGKNTQHAPLVLARPEAVLAENSG
jgi:hypothetical protein